MALKRTAVVTKKMSQLEDLKIEFENQKEKRQETFDNKSDRWKESEKGEEEEQNIADLEEIVDALQDAYDKIENLFEEE